MLEEKDKNSFSDSISNRRTYLRSISWSDGSSSNPNPRQQSISKTRACLPPLLPLSISKRSVEEWPKAGSDDLGVWPQPPTPGARSESSSERVFEFKKDKLAFFEKECSRISDNIYLGSDAIAKNRDILKQNGITHVLNCVGFVCPEYFKSDFVYKTLWLRDSPSEDITSILYDVFDYFEDVREQGGRVFVHCCQGVSRSTSLVIAYLMWREGQSFEDAFQYVKGARGVTNPNMGFACQLLQCQKRVHGMPASPNSVLRMYRMAPHSPYDPLHLVPKLLNHPCVQGLDTRGAFIVHVPTAMYIWIGKDCNMVMANTAKVAASQVIRYERAQGPIINIKEGEEPQEFYDALSSGQSLDGLREKTEFKKCGTFLVEDYDMDFKIFLKALDGGVVPPFPKSGTGSETRLPARKSVWGRLRRRLAEGIMQELVTSSKLNCDKSQPNLVIGNDFNDEERALVSPSDCSSPANYSPLDSPDSFSCSPNGRPYIKDSSPRSGRSSTDSFSYFLDKNPKLNSKSPSLSPSSTSDYSGSFTFSPSSSNWSDISHSSSHYPSPKDEFSIKNNNTLLIERSCLFCNETITSLEDAFLACNVAGTRVTNICLSCRGTSSPSIAERRGSNPPPPLMLLPKPPPPQSPTRNVVKSMEDSNFNYIIIKGDSNKLLFSLIIYQWPSMNKVENLCLDMLDSRSVYLMFVREGEMARNDRNTLYIWLGRDTDDRNHLNWETSGTEFLKQMGLPVDAILQIIRQDGEPEQFLNHFL